MSEDDGRFITLSKRMRIYKRAAEEREEPEKSPSFEPVVKQRGVARPGHATVIKDAEVLVLSVVEFSQGAFTSQPAPL